MIDMSDSGVSIFDESAGWSLCLEGRACRFRPNLTSVLTKGCKRKSGTLRRRAFEERLHIAKAFFLLLWCGKVSYVRPFLDGMSALRAAFHCTPIGKML